ncbi:hypothetical protein RFF05_06710 [Bengtsoniella intestinalis]|uniref:sodium:solute symporter family transporter n=1 Tax=Bengtsoniella intestinalis TaxID=3073143 RepID=UPI00391F78E5
MTENKEEFYSVYSLSILAVYAGVMFASTKLFSTAANSSDYHVAGRNLGLVQGALSIAATWIWAPALFTSAEKAYTFGLTGLLWFLVPNILCLLLFAPFAMRLRATMPDGVTMAGYMTKRYRSIAVGRTYQFQFLSIAVLSTAVQLLAGAKILNALTGLPFWGFTVLLAAIAFTYAHGSGIKASVLTDAIQMVVMLGCCVVLVYLALSNTNGMADLTAGLSGTGQYSAMEIFLAFGLPTAIGLLSAPFGDQCFWQRAFSIKASALGKSFAFGAVAFAIVPLSMGLLGFLAVGSGFQVVDTGMVNVELVAGLLPSWAMVLLMVMLLSGLLSTVDSNLCAVASLVSDWQVTSKLDNADKLRVSKVAMVILLIAGILIANIPGLTVTHLFLIYGTLRATTMLPTVLTLSGKELSAKGICAGVMTSIVVGMPIFMCGTLTGNTTYTTIGCLSALLLSGTVALLTAPRKAVRHG